MDIRKLLIKRPRLSEADPCAGTTSLACTEVIAPVSSAETGSSIMEIEGFEAQLSCSQPKDSVDEYDLDDQSASPGPDEPRLRDVQKPKALRGPPDISRNVTQGPVRPILQHYPKTMFGTRPRSFIVTWYEGNAWMEYSQIMNRVFCFACRHFPSQGAGKDSEATFTVTGYNNWKKAQYKDGGFNSHVLSSSHINAIDSWSQFKSMQATGSGSVMQMQNDLYKQQILENRHYIKTIAEVLLLTATQNIAQRGHREEAAMLSDWNAGNFRKILYLVAK